MWHCPQNDWICNQVWISEHVSHGDEQRTSVDKLGDLQIVYYTYEYSNQAMTYTTVSLDTFTLTEETN